jgi:hypothetical protein
MTLFYSFVVNFYPSVVSAIVASVPIMEKPVLIPFSHYKSVLKKSFWFDFPVRYPPYKKKVSIMNFILGR